MSRLPGTALRGGRVTAEQIPLLAACAADLFEAMPAPTLAQIPERVWPRSRVVEVQRAWCAASLPSSTSSLIRRAHAEGTDWLAATPFFASTRPVFTNGDGNLANYLCDGTRVRVVDFEYAGRSELSQELVEITEHLSGWVDTVFDAGGFLRRFDLTTQERRALAADRVLVALEWLHVLSEQDPQLGLNPPGTAERQAERVLALLAAL